MTWLFTCSVIICHLSMNVNETVVLPFCLSRNKLWFWSTKMIAVIFVVSFIWRFCPTIPLINIWIALVMLVTSTAPFVVVSDVATRGRSRGARVQQEMSSQNKSCVMIGGHCSECWIEDQCKHSATASWLPALSALRITMLPINSQYGYSVAQYFLLLSLGKYFSTHIAYQNEVFQLENL